MKIFRNKWAMGLGCSSLVICSVVGWFTWDSVFAWYCVRSLASSREADREIWVERVARLDWVGVKALVDCLKQEDDQACRNVQAGLDYISARWPADDPRSAALARHLAKSFLRLSFAGQGAAVE